ALPVPSVPAHWRAPGAYPRFPSGGKHLGGSLLSSRYAKWQVRASTRHAAGGARPVASNVNPTVRRRRLGQELRRLRELKGMTAEEVAERLLVSQSKISRLENGRRRISQRDGRGPCNVYEAEDQPTVVDLEPAGK